MAYYELVLAQHRVQGAQDKLGTGRRLLAQAQDLARQGRLPETELLELENAISRYQAGLSEAIQGRNERQNRLHTLAGSSRSSQAAGWGASDPLPQVPLAGPALKFDDMLAPALESRADYLMQRKVIEREGVQLVYATNQALPRIDLVATYGRNGLALSAAQAYRWSTMSDYPSWSIGLQGAAKCEKSLRARKGPSTPG